MKSVIEPRLGGGELHIFGGNPLEGELKLHGAKNSVLPLLAASTLSEDEVTVCDCPYISDIETMKRILSALGVDVSTKGRSITTSGKICKSSIPDTLACAMRSSIFLLGAMTAVNGEAEIVRPGGCDIGTRPYDLHLAGLRLMGAETEYTDRGAVCRAKSLHGADITLTMPSVGATENIVMAATLARGRTRIYGAAREPEIVDLCNFLNAMGASVKGFGTSVIEVEGVEKLHGASFTPTFDRIVLGTLAVGVSVVGGRLKIRNATSDKIASLLPLINNVVCQGFEDGIILERNKEKCGCFDVATGGYPLFPTDLQAPLSVSACLAEGVSHIKENVFENRFQHLSELVIMGAKATAKGDEATIEGVAKLRGATVYATDLRGGAALVLAGLAAKGETVVKNLCHIDRGYEKIEDTFTALGCNIFCCGRAKSDV